MECECFEANTANGKFKSPYKQTLGERGLIEKDVTIEMLSAPKRANVTSREAWQPQNLHRKVYCSKLEQQHVKLDYKNFNGSENILKVYYLYNNPLKRAKTKPSYSSSFGYEWKLPSSPKFLSSDFY